MSLACLEPALAAAGDADWRHTLELLLEAWRSVPATELAEAIEVIGRRAARGMPAPIGSTDEDREVAWRAAADKRDAVYLTALLASAVDTAPPERVVERMAMLVPYRDPRVGAKLADLMRHPFAPLGEDLATVWKPLHGLLRTCGDPRMVTWFSGFAHRPVRPARQQASEQALHDLHRRLLETYGQRPPELASEHRETVAAICALGEERESVTERDAAVERGLLSAIYAAPRDDGPRAIYADWLLERGDLHGEMIALQLADPNSVRGYQLSKQLRERLLGPLAECVEDERYERGFLARCTSRRRFWSRRDERALPVDPRWSTVREIRGGLPATDDHPMPALESALDLPPEAFEQLAGLAAPPPLVRIGLHGESMSERKVAAAAFASFARRMPTLRALELRGGMHHPGDPSWPWAETSIREVVVSARFVDAPAWFVIALESGLDRFEVTAAPQWYQTAPTAALAGRTLHVRNVAPDTEEIDTIAELLEELPRGRISTVKVMTTGAAWSLASRRRIENALDRHPGIAVDVAGFTRVRG